MAAIPQFTHTQQALAEMRTQLAERFTPELTMRIVLFAFTSIAIALLALIVLALTHATYEPFSWAVLVLTGAAYGWYARTDLTMPRQSGLTIIYPFDTDEPDDDEGDNQRPARYETVRLYEEVD